MLHDAASLPPEPIHHDAEAARVVVEEALGINVRGPQHLDLGRAPDGAQGIQRRGRAIGRDKRVVVLFNYHYYYYHYHQ